MDKPTTIIPHTFDSAATLNSIKQMAFEAGVPHDAYMKSLQSDLKRTADPQRALNNLQRFLSAGFSATKLRDFHRSGVLQRVALEIFAQSQYLADILVRNPELFNWITSTSALGRVSAKSSYLNDARASVAPFERFEKKLNALKRFHRRELLRIGAREILKEVDVSVTAEELSLLADAVVAVVLDLVTDNVLGNAHPEFRSTLAVIGLGKLGGGELNFSSDIDLQFVYDADAEFDVPELRVRTLHELYSRIAEITVRKLTEMTEEGRFYRVDLRLRPEGTTGPIALSRAAAMNYYETRGEQWERQMLIKARVMAGDATTGEQFLNEIQSFIFPRTQLGSPLEEIAAIKRKIEAKTDAEANIKLGSGGIRDIEFIVQALQLMNAGKREELRVRNTLKALERLSKAKLLNARESANLRAAYTFHRTLEHRLQLLFGKQTHSLPELPAEVEFLAKRLGFRASAQFKRKLEAHRVMVRKIFASVFGLRADKSANIAAVNAPGALRKHGFLEPAKASEQLEKVFESLPELREPKLQNKLIAALKKYRAPDWGLRNLLSLAGNKHLRRSLLQALTNDGAREIVMLVCSRTVRFTQLLAREPLLFETLLSNPAEILGEQLGWALLKSDQAHYHAFNEFKIVLRWLTGRTNTVQMLGECSHLADDMLAARIEELRSEGVPFAMCAVGKYGGQEITVGSDLDLLFIYRAGGEVSARKAEAVARKFSSSFAEQGQAVYDIDMRLRPEGKSAPLAVEVDYYREYLYGRASLWERQSLVKLRAVGGDETLLRDVAELVQEFTYASPLPRKWVDEVVRMRTTIEHERSKGISAAEDLKVGRGGLVDIEFLLQMLQLKFGRQVQDVRVSNTFDLVDVLRRKKILSTREAKQITSNLAYLRSLETLVRLNAVQNAFVLPKESTHLAALAAGMGEKSVKAFHSRIKKIQQSNRALLQTMYKQCKQ